MTASGGSVGACSVLFIWPSALHCIFLLATWLTDHSHMYNHNVSCHRFALML